MAAVQMTCSARITDASLLSRCQQRSKPSFKAGLTLRTLTPQSRSHATARSVVICAVSGGPKNTNTNKNLVVRSEDPLAGRSYRPAMPGDDPDLWEGARWDILGFVLEYLWAFGIVLAITASVYAVSNYSTEDVPSAPGTESVTVEQAPAAVEQSYDFEDDAPPL